jgi:hypothetical protein
MIRRALLTYLWVFLYILVPVVNLAVADGGRVALVIGNADYQGERLDNPVHDAASIGQTMRRLGFRVDLLTNANRRQMSEAINRFASKLKSNEVGFFYFSGHGAQVNGENYLIPIDARVENERDIKYATVHIGEVLDAMADAKNAVNIVIIDACRNNPFARSWRSSTRGLAPIHAATGMIIAYSTAPGQLASDGPAGGNSPYMKHLMTEMLMPGLPVEQVFKKVRVDVQRETGGKQMPWESSSLMGEFSFNPSSKLATPPADLTPPPRPSFSPASPGSSGSSGAVLQRAQKAYIDGHFAQPAGNNAIELARQVLQSEPGNRTARDLMTLAASAAERQAKTALEKQDRHAALKIYQRLATLLPEQENYLKEASSLEKSASLSIIGSWHWKSDVPWEPESNVTIIADGIWKNSLGQVGKWNSPGGDTNHVVVYWNEWYVHDMTLSADGLSMTGKNNFGVGVRARRLSDP